MALRLPDTRALPTELLWNLTLRELRGRFKRSTLGWLWSIINPLASIAIYSLVFGVFLDVTPPVGDPSGLHVYGFFLVCGLLPWTFLTNGLNGAVSSIVVNEGLVKKVYFPRSVLPAASTLAWLANFGVELVVLGAVLLVAGNMILPWVPVVVVLMVLQTGFVLGLGLLLSAANAYFRDIQHFLGIVLNIWFYSTPILYPAGTIPETAEVAGASIPVRDLLELNPMAIFVDSYRAVLYDLTWPTPRQWAAMLVVSVITLAVGAAPAIVVSDVAKRFRLVHERNSTLKAMIFNGFRRTVHEEFWALKGVSFEVEEGTTYGLIGHNGSGKSTLLKCMARIYRPDRGEIRTRGRVSALLELGAGFHPELSGRENVYLNASILGLSRREVDKRFDDIVSFAGLEQFIDTPVKNYSSGMFVRLGFSVAITVEPDVLLIDEILAVGDEAFQQRCMEKFADLRRTGRTIVLVSHGLDSVRSICDRAAWLDHGDLVKEGESHDVVTAYLESVRDDRRAREHRSGELVTPEEATDDWHVRDVQLLDAAGRDAGVVGSGEELTIRICVEAARDEDVALAIGLYRTDGVHVAGPVHRFRTGGPGVRVIDYHIPRLSLASGTYDVSTRLLDDHLQRTYAVRRRAARLDVSSDQAAEVGGVVALGGSWQVTDGR